MATFQYLARNPRGKQVSGTLQAENQGDVAAQLRRKKLTLINLRIVSQGAASGRTGGASNKKPFVFYLLMLLGPIGYGLWQMTRPRVKLLEMVIFTRQLSTMISAGLPLLECLEVLQEQVENEYFQKVLDEIIEDVRAGNDLSSAIEAQSAVFSKIYVAMCRAGEASGQLDDILVRLAEYLEAMAKLRREIISAMTYPVVSMFLVLGITAFLMIGIVPKFKEIFDSLNVDLPAITQILLTISLLLTDWWHLIILGGFVLGMIFAALKSTRPGEKAWDIFLLKTPVFGPLLRKVALSRFSRTFSTLIKSGVPILGALEIVANTAGNRVVEDAVLDSCEAVRSGQPLATPLARAWVFPPMVIRMISIGEKTGALEQLLEKIAEFYDQQVTAAVDSLTALIEPILIAMMGFLVGGIVLAIFLPIFKLQESLQS
jgi:type IV pilus assembly protein PilC